MERSDVYFNVIVYSVVILLALWSPSFSACSSLIFLGFLLNFTSELVHVSPCGEGSKKNPASCHLIVSDSVPVKAVFVSKIFMADDVKMIFKK